MNNYVKAFTLSVILNLDLKQIMAAVNRQQRRIWVRKIFQSQSTTREYHALINELRIVERKCFYQYFHMTPRRFVHLLSLVESSITRQNTHFHDSVTANKLLALTLWYLVTRDSLQTISLSYRVDSTCDALWNTLAPIYLKRPFTPAQWKRVSEDFENVWNLRWGYSI